VQAIYRHYHTVFRFTWYNVVYILLQINALLSYTLVLVLILGTGITRGQYYWILDIGCLVWYCSNPTCRRVWPWMAVTHYIALSLCFMQPTTQI